MYNTISTTNEKNATDLIRAYCNKLSINESNYLAITITLPYIACKKQQRAQIEQILNSISFPFIGAIEYTDDVNKANGYHAHLIASNEHIQAVQAITGVHISNNYISKDSWIYYITNKQELKQFFKWKYAPAQQLQFDFNNQTAESNEITPPTKEKKEINNMPFKRLIKDRAKYIHMFLLRVLNVFFLMDEVAIRGRGDPILKKQTIYK